MHNSSCSLYYSYLYCVLYNYLLQLSYIPWEWAIISDRIDNINIQYNGMLNGCIACCAILVIGLCMYRI